MGLFDGFVYSLGCFCEFELMFVGVTFGGLGVRCLSQCDVSHVRCLWLILWKLKNK